VFISTSHCFNTDFLYFSFQEMLNDFQIPRIIPSAKLNQWIGFSELASTPRGTQPPYSWVRSKKSGDMATYNALRGSGEPSLNTIQLGKALSAGLTGSGTVSSASLSLIVQFLADLVGSGDMDGSLQAILSMSADLAGSGDLDGALGLIAWMLADLSGEGGADGSNLRGTARLEADITVTGGNLTAGQCAAAVWQAIASQYEEPGTMGKKLNDAGSAGDPWSTLKASYNDPETFGGFVKKLLTLAKYIGLKK
jgi:hypothetical protein